MGTTGNSDLRTFFFGTGNAIISLHLSHLTSTYFISLVSPLVIFFKSSGETSGESSLIICFGGATGTSGIFRSDFPSLKNSNDFSFSFFVFSFSFFFDGVVDLIKDRSFDDSSDFCSEGKIGTDGSSGSLMTFISSIFLFWISSSSCSLFSN